MKQVRLAILLIFTISLFSCQQQKTEVIICGTIHGAHRTNPNYSYDDLYAFIEKTNPDIVGVEIRPEDMDSSVNYLKSNYPSEMFESISKFQEKKFIGFDWLGDNIKGKAIPENYWKEISVIKKLSREQSQDSIMNKKMEVLAPIVTEIKAVFLDASLSEFNDGTYDSLTTIYYKELARLHQNTKYETITDFYLQRDEHIAKNIIQTIKENPGKKMIFLMGGDHRAYSNNAVKQEFGDQIVLFNFSE